MKKQWNVSVDGRDMTSGEIISAIFDSRNIDDTTHFLCPNEEDLIPFEKMLNIDKAFEIVDDALTMGESFFVYADTDCDGCTSGAIILRYLLNFTNNVDYYINEGKAHGIENFDMSQCNSDVVIIVDSINEPDCYKKFTDVGKKVIILDHHIIDRVNRDLLQGEQDGHQNGGDIVVGNGRKLLGKGIPTGFDRHIVGRRLPIDIVMPVHIQLQHKRRSHQAQ